GSIWARRSAAGLVTGRSGRRSCPTGRSGHPNKRRRGRATETAAASREKEWAVPTTISQVEGVWVFKGPWGEREFASFASEPDPARRLAAELALPPRATLEEVRATLANKSWDTQGGRWVDDAPAPPSGSAN